MYPIDVEHLIRRETIGSRANDPTLRDRPRRFARLRRRLARQAPGFADTANPATASATR